MKPRTQCTVAGLAVGALLLAWFGVALLLFCVPALAAYWEKTGAELSPAARMLLQFGNLALRSFFLMGLLPVATVASVVWCVALLLRAWLRACL